MTTEKKQNQVTDEELVAFEKMQQRVSKNLGELYDRINEETISQAIDKATTELKEAGEHSSEAISKASAALKKDIASTTKYLKPKLDQATEETKKLLTIGSTKVAHFGTTLPKRQSMYMNSPVIKVEPSWLMSLEG